jgi:hypothetical protein
MLDCPLLTRAAQHHAREAGQRPGDGIDDNRYLFTLMPETLADVMLPPMA